MSKRIRNWICDDCSKDCSLDNKDYYMVKHEIWDDFGTGVGKLCMSCIEERIGHPLTKDDILICPLTLSNYYTKNILYGGN